MKILLILLIPLIGTILGSVVVWFSKDEFNKKIEKLLLGFASGVMMGACIWSLILPSIDLSSSWDVYAWIPVIIGFGAGMIVLIIIEQIISMYRKNKQIEDYNYKKQIILLTAVTIHNIPEGMAIGVMLAGLIINSEIISLVGAVTLAIGLAIQNIPEGAVISMGLKSKGVSKNKSFISASFTGIVELLGAIITMILTKLVTPILPYFLSFAAGAMMYVIVDDLLPQSHDNNFKNGVIGFSIGFCLMMILDITLT